MTALLGIGIGAPGLGALPPSPGCTAIVTVTTTRTFPDGEHTDTHTYTWDGYTADDARRHRWTRSRDAHHDITRDGDRLIIRRDTGDWMETAVYQYADTPTERQP